MGIRIGLGWMVRWAAIAAACIALVAYCAYQKQSVNARLFPGLANRGTSSEMTAVAMYSQTASGYVHWSIPKAYLTWASNWSGGHQAFIDAEAAIYWDTDDMPPWSKAKDGDAIGRKPDDKLFVHIAGAGNFLGKHRWETVVLPKLEAVNTAGDLKEYRYKPGPAAVSSTVFAPREQEGFSIYFECVQNRYGALLGCHAHTDYSRDVVLEYVFSSRNISRWREIDSKARLLVDGFRAPRAAFPVSD